MTNHVCQWVKRDDRWWCLPGDHGYDGPRAVARSSDPDTSWEAASRVRHLTATREAVLACLRARGGLTDAEIWDTLPREHRTTPSGIRTRRSELVHLGLVVDTGARRLGPTGRRMIVWEAVKHGDGGARIGTSAQTAQLLDGSR